MLRPSPLFRAAARRRLLPVALAAAFVLSGCAGDDKKDDYVERNNFV